MIKIIFFKKNIKYFSEMLDKFWETCIIAKVITNGRLAQLGEHQSYYTQNIISYNDIITVIILTDRLLSDTIINIVNGRLAQLGEHLPYKQRVGGSIPSTSMRLVGEVA